jgi:spore coat polysaccharide biosynthesis predicted glycosyltransferase SpsG
MNAVHRVVVRVDASTAMGMGHLMRCLSLARALADNGASVFFLLRSHAAGLVPLIESEGHSVRLLQDPDRRPDAPAADGTACTSPSP